MRQVERKCRRRNFQLLADHARAQPLRPGLYQQAKNCQPRFMSESSKAFRGDIRFHVSRILELSSGVKPYFWTSALSSRVCLPQVIRRFWETDNLALRSMECDELTQSREQPKVDDYEDDEQTLKRSPAMSSYVEPRKPLYEILRQRNRRRFNDNGHIGIAYAVRREIKARRLRTFCTGPISAGLEFETGSVPLRLNDGCWHASPSIPGHKLQDQN